MSDRTAAASAPRRIWENAAAPKISLRPTRRWTNRSRSPAALHARKSQNQEIDLLAVLRQGQDQHLETDMGLAHHEGRALEIKRATCLRHPPSDIRPAIPI